MSHTKDLLKATFSVVSSACKYKQEDGMCTRKNEEGRLVKCSLESIPTWSSPWCDFAYELEARILEQQQEVKCHVGLKCKKWVNGAARCKNKIVNISEYGLCEERTRELFQDELRKKIKSFESGMNFIVTKSIVDIEETVQRLLGVELR